MRNILALALALLLGPFSAEAGQLALLGAGRGASAPPAGVTWNPADKAADLTLSNGNLTAQPAAAANNGVRGTTSKSTGKYYFEVRLDSRTGGNAVIGLAPSGWSMTSALQLASGSVAFVGIDGQLYVNGSLVATYTGMTVGDTLCIAVDLTDDLVWVRVNAGNWNGSGTANPATGTEGKTIAAATVPIFPAFSSANTSVAVSARFTGFAFSAPSGFVPW